MTTKRNLEIVRYQSSMSEEWNDAIRNAENGIFLFNRKYMDYHAHRFVDHSLVVKENGTILALLPANEQSACIYSHQGLTYGGWIFCKRMNAGDVNQLFVMMESYYKEQGIREIAYKLKPSIFSSRICETDAWMLWHHGYEMWRRDLNFVIDLQCNPGFAHDKHYRLNKSKRNDLRIETQGNVKELMSLVTHNLKERFQLSPTHTSDEAELLQQRFPDNIYTINVYRGDEFLGGTWLFVDNQFIHTQYLHSSDNGKVLCAIEFLVDYLIDRYRNQKRYLSFGTSTEFDGKVLNEGLAAFKEGFGASGVCHDFYKKQLC